MVMADPTVLKVLNSFKDGGGEWLPDYSSAEKINTSGSGVVYTPLEDGYFRCEDASGGDYRGFSVYYGTSSSGTRIAHSYQNRYPGACIMLVPVVKGQQYFIVSNQNTVYFHKLLKRTS